MWYLFWTGAYKIYHSYLKIHFDKYESHIDESIEDAQIALISKIKKLCLELISQSGESAVTLSSLLFSYLLNFRNASKNNKKDS